MIKELREFLTRGNVVDLAVAVVIGAAFTLIVTAFVEGVITPLIAAIFGQVSFDTLGVLLRENGPGPEDDVVLAYGRVLTAVINFVLVGTFLFFVVRAANASKKKQDVDPEMPPSDPDDVLLLREIRDVLLAGSGVPTVPPAPPPAP